MTDIHESPTGAEQVHAMPATPPNTPQPNPIDGSVPGEQTIAGTSFKTTDDLAAAYKNLQAEFTRFKQEATKPSEPDVPEKTPPAEEPEPDAPESANPDWQWDAPLSSYFDSEKGELTADAKAVFESAGIPEDVVVQHFQQMAALQTFASQYFQMKAEALAGGPENWKAVQEYIGANMPNLADDLNNPEKYEFVIEAAMARMQRNNGVSNEPSPAPSTSMAQGSTEPYLLPNSPEALRAMSDPRFRTDPDYQREVRERVQRGAMIAARNKR